MQPVEKWYSAMKNKETADWNELLDENVEFHSPVVYTPQRGKQITKTYLQAASSIFGSDQFKRPSEDDTKKSSGFRYIKEIIGETSALLEFESEIDGVYINGVDLLTWNEAGKLTEVKVMVRPLQAVNMLHQQMKAMLERMS
ncbi:MAG: hypothetical protein L7S47_06070 [Acidimicrobiales bacterium]|nr:hypothetical protein [Acidimicrobiales bacterium]